MCPERIRWNNVFENPIDFHSTGFTFLRLTLPEISFFTPDPHGILGSYCKRVQDDFSEIQFLKPPYVTILWYF